jgi:hypothetical protein
MPKFTLIAEYEDGMKMTTEFNEEYIHTVVDNMGMFLRGVGFVFNGNLEIVEDEYPTTDTSALDSAWSDNGLFGETEINLDYGAAQPAVFSPISDEITITLTPGDTK